MMIKMSPSLYLNAFTILSTCPTTPLRTSCHDASEFNSAEVQQICWNNGIKREFSNPGQQFQNGKGEKCVGDVWLMRKTTLLFSNVPRALWDKAWFNASYVKRHLPTTANEGF
jgi:transposase InsO family protein